MNETDKIIYLLDKVTGDVKKLKSKEFLDWYLDYLVNLSFKIKDRTLNKWVEDYVVQLLSMGLPVDGNVYWFHEIWLPRISDNGPEYVVLIESPIHMYRELDRYRRDYLEGPLINKTYSNADLVKMQILAIANRECIRSLYEKEKERIVKNCEQIKDIGEEIK